MSGLVQRMTPSTLSAKSVDELRIGDLIARAVRVVRHRIDRRTEAPTPPLMIAHAVASTGSPGRSGEAVVGAQALQAPKEAPPGGTGGAGASRGGDRRTRGGEAGRRGNIKGARADVLFHTLCLEGHYFRHTRRQNGGMHADQFVFYASGACVQLPAGQLSFQDLAKSVPGQVRE